MSIYLTALLKCKAGEAAKVKPLLLDLVAASAKEEACLQYELYQDSEDENQFIFHETWKDAAGLEQHTQQAHYKKFGQEVGPLLEGAPTLHKTQRIA
jgi:quinol monooxygenase YgiN